MTRTLIGFKLTENDLRLLDAVADAITPTGCERATRADAHRHAVAIAAEKHGISTAETSTKKTLRKSRKSA